MNGSAAPPSGEFGARVFQGVAWLSGSAGLRSALRLVRTLVLVKLLEPESFGLMAAALVVTGVLGIVATLGVGAALVQREQVGPAELGVARLICIVAGIVSTLAVAGASGWISWLYGMPDLKGVLIVLAPVLLFHLLLIVPEAQLKRQLQFRSLALAELSGLFSYLVIAIVLASLGAGVWSLVAAALVESLLRTRLMSRLCRSSGRPRWNAGIARQLIREGRSFTAARTFSLLALRTDNFVVGRWLGAGPLGLYTRAYAVITIPVDLIGAVVQRVLFPTFSRLQGDPRKIRMTYERGVALLACLLLPASMAIAVFAEEVVYALLNPSWLEVTPCLQVLSLGAYFRTAYKLSGIVVDSTGGAHQNARIQLAYVALVAAGSLTGQRYGLTGVAIGVVAAQAVEFWLTARAALLTLKLTWRGFLWLHLRAVLLGTLFLGISVLLARLGHHLQLSPPLRLLVGVVGLAGTAALLLMAVPKLVLGSPGGWAVALIARHTGSRFPRASACLHGLSRRVHGGGAPM